MQKNRHDQITNLAMLHCQRWKTVQLEAPLAARDNAPLDSAAEKPPPHPTLPALLLHPASSAIAHPPLSPAGLGSSPLRSSRCSSTPAPHFANELHACSSLFESSTPLLVLYPPPLGLPTVLLLPTPCAVAPNRKNSPSAPRPLLT